MTQFWKTRQNALGISLISVKKHSTLVQKSSVGIPFLSVSWCTLMLFADSAKHLENTITFFNRPLPPKMANQFMLHDKETEGIQFLLSVCELLGDEYLISWLLSARMYVSGTAMHITTHTSFTTACFACPPAPCPPTWLMGTEKTILKNHTQAPQGLAPPKTWQTTAKTLWKIGRKNQTERRVYI